MEGIYLFIFDTTNVTAFCVGDRKDILKKLVLYHKFCKYYVSLCLLPLLVEALAFKG